MLIMLSSIIRRLLLVIIIIVASLVLLLIPSLVSSSSSSSSSSPIVVPYKELMPSVLHTNAQALASRVHLRIFLHEHKCAIILIHSPSSLLKSSFLQKSNNNKKKDSSAPLFSLYHDYEELGKRIGSFVGVVALNYDENPSYAKEHFLLSKKIGEHPTPALRYWSSGSDKEMNGLKMGLSVDQIEDFMLDELVRTNFTMIYDYLNVLDDDVENDEEVDKEETESTMSSEDDHQSSKELKGKMTTNDNNNNKVITNKDDNNEYDELVILRRKRQLLKKRQDEEIQRKSSKVTSRKTFIFSIFLPADPSPEFIAFEEGGILQRQIRRLETIVHTAAQHYLTMNNLGIALVKDEDENLKDSIRVKLQVFNADDAVKHDDETLVERIYTLEELSETELDGNVSRTKLRLPFPLQWFQICRLIVQTIKSPYPEELKPGEEVITEIKNFKFWNQLYKYDEMRKGTPESEIQEFPRKNTNYFIRYRPVLDTCKTLRECFSNESIPNSIPFIVRQTPEFQEPPSNIKTAEDILKFYISEAAAKVVIEGALPQVDYFEDTLQNFAKRWSKTGDDFNVNLFQSHVYRETFPYKLPTVFDDFFPKDDSDANSTEVLLSPQFSYKGADTSWHVDPPDMGGGYLHLVHGKKFWKFMNRDHYPVARFVENFFGEMRLKHSERFFNLSLPDEIVVRNNKNNDEQEGQQEDHYFDIYGGEIRAGDTVVFPPGGLHRVWTGDDENTIGVVGYTLIRSNKESTLWKKVREYSDAIYLRTRGGGKVLVRGKKVDNGWKEFAKQMDIDE